MLYKNKTQKQWQTEIASYGFKNLVKEVMQDLYPDMLFEKHGGSTNEEVYDGIKVYQIVSGTFVYSVKLSYNDDVLPLVTQIKSNMLSKINKIFELLELKNLLTVSKQYQQLSSFANLGLLVEYIAENETDEFVDNLKDQDDALFIEQDLQNNINLKLKRMNFGNKIIALINYLNESNGITQLQLQTIFSNQYIITIMSALQTGSLNTAKYLIGQIDLTDLAPMDQSYKDLITQMIDDFED